jgi:hypothetical protein
MQMSSIEQILIDPAKACNQSFGVPNCAGLFAAAASPLVGILAGTFPTHRNSLHDWEGKR